MKPVLAAALSLFAFSAAAQQPPPQPQCFDPVLLIEMLSEQFNETPIATGESQDGKSLLVVFASEKGATWTLVLRVGRVACIIDTGNNWAETPFKPKQRGT